MYPLLTRLHREGLVEATWEESPSGPPRRYYRITKEGRSALKAFITQWERFRTTVDGLLDPGGTRWLQGDALCEDYLQAPHGGAERGSGPRPGSDTHPDLGSPARGRAALPVQTEAGVTQILDRLGPPEEIAQAADNEAE